MEIQLPAELRAICDLSTLKLESGSFVEDDRRQYFSDVLYSLKTTTGDDGYVHVLIEAQSSPDKHSPYPYSTNWLQEFDDPALAGKLYTGDFPLVDVTVIPDEEIMGHRSMAALTLLKKHIRQRDLAELADKLATILLAGYLTSPQLISLVHYIIQAGESSDAEAFIRELALRVPQNEEELMTIAQQLEQKGIEKGIQLGRQEGRQQGVLEGKLQVARTMLANGIDRDSVMKMTGLTADDLAQIRH